MYVSMTSNPTRTRKLEVRTLLLFRRNPAMCREKMVAMARAVMPWERNSLVWVS